MWNGARLLREKLQAGRFVTGFAATLSDPAVSEMAACAGYDFVFVDGEHPPMDRQTILRHVMAAQGGRAAALIRVWGCDPPALKALLDLGPDGVIFPFVHDGDAARQAVAACSYPDQLPGGLRGQGPLRAARWGFGDGMGYLEDPGRYLLRIMQIESYEGWKNLDEILAVPAVDGIYLGPADLGRSLRAQSGPGVPGLEEACLDVFQKTRAAGKWMGAPLPNSREGIASAREKGAQWGVCGIDAELLAAGMRDCLNASGKL